MSTMCPEVKRQKVSPSPTMLIKKVLINEEFPESCLTCSFGYMWYTKKFCELKKYSLKNRNDYCGESKDRTR